MISYFSSTPIKLRVTWGQLKAFSLIFEDDHTKSYKIFAMKIVDEKRKKIVIKMAYFKIT